MRELVLMLSHLSKTAPFREQFCLNYFRTVFTYTLKEVPQPQVVARRREQIAGAALRRPHDLGRRVGVVERAP